jgi:hypothetical protein
MPADNDDLKNSIYSSQNETIALLYNTQKDAKDNINKINAQLTNLIPPKNRQSLFLFPFTNTVSLSKPIKAIKEIFLNQIILIESNGRTNVSIDYDKILEFIDKMETYDAFKIAEHIQTEYLHNEQHALKRIKTDCRRLIPICSSSTQKLLESKNNTIIKLKALKDSEQSLNCLESLGKLVDITLNTTSPFEAKGLKIMPGQSHIDETMRLYYFKNGNIRLAFNDPENTEKIVSALMTPF